MDLTKAKRQDFEPSVEQARYSSYRQNTAQGPPKPQEVTSPCRPSHSDDAHLVIQGEKDSSSRYGTCILSFLSCLLMGSELPTSFSSFRAGEWVLLPQKLHCLLSSLRDALPPCCSSDADAWPLLWRAMPPTSGSSGRNSCSSSSGSKWRSSSKSNSLLRRLKRRIRVCEEDGCRSPRADCSGGGSSLILGQSVRSKPELSGTSLVTG